MKKQTGIIALLALCLVLLASTATAISYEDLTYEEQRNLLQASFIVTELQEEKGLASSSVQPIIVSDPYAAAGTPVMVEFELKNVGEGAPLNQIPLPPNVFALVVGVDREIGFRTVDGREINVFDRMSGIQKFFYLTSVGAESAFDTTKNAIVGRQCSFINVYNNLPKSVKEEVVDLNDGKTPEVYSWDCLKITDEENFEDVIKTSCRDNAYTSSCLATINNRNANSLTNTVVALLVSDDELDRGECELVRGNNPIAWLSKSTLRCNIGEEGILPGESVKFRFFIVVPADTPVANTEDLAESGEIQEGTTYQASCLNSDFPRQCHTIYGAVYPTSQENLLAWFVDGVGSGLNLGSCGANQIWNLGQADFVSCLRSRTNQVDIVGEPIWEGQGTFFVLGPDLDASITLTIIVSSAITGLTGVALSRRLRGN